MIKTIKGFKNYVVTHTGEIFRKNPDKTYRILKPRRDRDGYLLVNLSKDGKLTTMKVHRIVAAHYIPNPKKRKTVNHIDGNKSNNNISNLEWLTRKQNLLAKTGKKRKTITKAHRLALKRITNALGVLDAIPLKSKSVKRVIKLLRD